ncbi:metal ABC transporter ATP-binding protein [Bombiscardovia coagulans]|uniref:ABC transporter ATP-binding protein n=1 Tax=Bombiscardovia coagulans TaxID=686666 RepID=A0A261ET30_9BIFI|nr:ATP-binding cassette domain-containing protein [Bombiscardovia coagulans]OZG50011.1 ABC transporter ATP-binding protein [Bombiscardovia coagulans]
MDKQTHHSPAIVLDNAAISRGGHTIWSHGNFSIPTASVTAIVGTNGAGKTSLLKAELGLLASSSGSIEVLGQPAGKAKAKIGYVPQSYSNQDDVNLTVEQSVLLGINGNRFGIHPTRVSERGQARRAMSLTGIEDRAAARLGELSGGLRQRAAIAQALASDPELLILDEPLANLDLASQRECVQVLSNLNHELGMTIQIVAHDLNVLLPILTGAVYILDGRPHYANIHDVMNSDLLTQLYGTPVEVVTTPQGNMFISPHAGGSKPKEQNLHTRSRNCQQ